ncbi:tRNA pseudouridine synthase B [Rosistilla carotiformis]|uniref:tRNA pseudouridine synthase B n=1 Tax=Rosistilla carotiformis TaxID=2528017 RepID=A0A518JRI7_9BACT|nr:tRNA pseudouridine(55) synthase TruB [Rosistilla carotiformis]QDV68160.1 tRNA pseudouridine synthase B [Rosistilla carotiformis]
MFGILNVHKPQGITSRAAVNRVYRAVRPNKAGHAGTLDPLARGVLLVPIGSASRLVPYLHLLPKRYVAKFAFGKSSPSDDSETEVTEHPHLPAPTRLQLEQACDAMRGQVMQRPPAYSAIKVDGKRSYKMARHGDLQSLPERPVQIHQITMLRYEFPELELEIDCGSGTYVRSIGRDLAQGLGTEAIMTSLVRTAIGPFTVEDSISIDRLTPEAARAALQPAARGIMHMPQLVLDDAEVTEIINGRMIPFRWSGPGCINDPQEIAALDQAGRLRGILYSRDGGLGPKRVFPESMD